MTLASLVGSLWLSLALASSAEAQTIEEIIREMNGGRRYVGSLAWLRLLLMLGAVGAGFAVGWFLSPGAQPFRLVVGWLVASIIFVIALGNEGWLGWSATSLVCTVGAAIAFGYWAAKGIRALGQVPTTFGSSRWADLDHMAAHGLFDEGGVILGDMVDEDGSLISVFYNGERHLLTNAPTRSGKGVCHVIPNLLTYQGSMLVIDPKG